MAPLEIVLEVVSKIRHLRNGETVDSMRRLGIVYPVSYGVSIPQLKEISIDYKGNHSLSLALYEQDIRECKILATMIDDPQQVSGEQIDEWSKHFKNIEIVEQTCSNLFWKADASLSRSIEWCLSDDPLLIKAGLIIAMRKATDPQVKDAAFEAYFDLVENLPNEQEFNYTGYAVGALRQIAYRSENLLAKTHATAIRLAESQSAIKAWIGNQLLFEFD